MANGPPSSHHRSIAHSAAPHSRFETTIAALAALLLATDNAEELRHTWEGARTPTPDHGPTRTSAAVGAPSLRSIKSALDSGRRVAAPPITNQATAKQGPQRGIPLWIIIRTLKASWHADGTWPLRGADEDSPSPPASPPSPSSSALPSLPSTPPRSIHPFALLLRPPRSSAPTQTQKMEPGPPARPDPDPEHIASAYRRRGVQVPGLDEVREVREVRRLERFEGRDGDGEDDR